MIEWKRYNESMNSRFWDTQLNNFTGFTFYQAYNWGEHRVNFGWKVYRWLAFEGDDELKSMAQALVKVLPFGITIAWISGGPVGPVKAWSEDIKRLLIKETGCNHIYIRILNNKILNESDTVELVNSGWSYPSVKLRSGLSMMLSLNKELESLRQGMTKNWRRNLTRGEKHGLQITQWKDPNIDEIYELYKSMQKLKGIDEQFSREELESIFKYLSDNIVIFKCTNSEGKLIAIRGCFIIGRYAWDLFAAASEEARKIYATYVLLWNLLSHCKCINVLDYDLMGIDPDNNQGVYNFKKGTGAITIKYLGEWEWSSNFILKFAINIALKYKLV